jgi:Na+/phosphate symporter
MLRIVAELEEVGDAIYRLIQITQRKYRKSRLFGDKDTSTVLAFSDRILELIDLYIDVLDTEADEEKLKRAIALERETDKLRKKFNKEAMNRMGEVDTEVKTEMVSIDINNQFEQIANYGLNVVQTAFYLLHEDEVPDKYEGA